LLDCRGAAIFAAFAMAKCVDCLRIEPQFIEYRLVVFSNFRSRLVVPWQNRALASGLLIIDISIPRHPQAETTPFSRNCGSTMTSQGLRTMP
jgi:hypothetical protein